MKSEHDIQGEEILAGKMDFMLSRLRVVQHMF